MSSSFGKAIPHISSRCEVVANMDLALVDRMLFMDEGAAEEKNGSHGPVNVVRERRGDNPVSVQTVLMMSKSGNCRYRLSIVSR